MPARSLCADSQSKATFDAGGHTYTTAFHAAAMTNNDKDCADTLPSTTLHFKK